MIGVFDSGIGGLTILAAIHRQLPRESLLYFADQAYSPYGNLSTERLHARSEFIINNLIERGADLVVIACNTATAATIDAMRQRFAIPIVGVEPGIKPAALRSQSRRIGILATANTVASDRYAELMRRFVPEVEIFSQPCVGLADAIEHNRPEKSALLARYVAPLLAAEIDHLVLGCTHYPLLIDALTELLGEQVGIIDTSDAVAQEAVRRLPTSTHQSQPLQLLTSGPDAALTTALHAYDSLAWLRAAPVQTVAESCLP